MSKSPRSPVRPPIKARTLSELGDADEASYPFLQESFPATLGALGLEHRRPSFSAWSDAVGQHDVLGSFTDDEPSDDDDEPAPRCRLVAPSKFGRPAEDSGWEPEERAVRDAALARLDAGAAAHLRANDLLFLRLVRGFRLLEDRAAATADMCAWVADRRLAWDAFRLLPAVGDDLRFHEAVWPTWVAGRDGFGHLVVLERLGLIDFDSLLKLPLDLILRRRVQALDGLQRELARPLEGYGRVYKCVFLVDVAGASFGTLMRSETTALAKAYARLTERMYADAVWKNVVVNAPAVARGAWRVVERLLDDETKDLISFVHAPPGAADTPGKLRAAGVPRAACPAYLGGAAKPVLLADLLARGDGGADLVPPPEPRPDAARLRRFSSHDDDGRSRPPGFRDDDEASPRRGDGAAGGLLNIKVVLALFLVFDVFVFWYKSRKRWQADEL